MGYAAAKGVGLSSVAKSVALGVVVIHKERVRAFAFPRYVAFPISIFERIRRFPTLSILWIPRKQIHPHPMALHEFVSALVIKRAHHSHSQKAAWVSQRLKQREN